MAATPPLIALEPSRLSQTGEYGGVQHEGLHVASHLWYIRSHLVGQVLSSGMQLAKQESSCETQTLQQTEALTGPLPVDDRAQGIASRTPRIKSFLTNLGISILSFLVTKLNGQIVPHGTKKSFAGYSSPGNEIIAPEVKGAGSRWRQTPRPPCRLATGLSRRRPRHRSC